MYLYIFTHDHNSVYLIKCTNFKQDLSVCNFLKAVRIFISYLRIDSKLMSRHVDGILLYYTFKYT